MKTIHPLILLFILIVAMSYLMVKFEPFKPIPESTTYDNVIKVDVHDVDSIIMLWEEVKQRYFVPAETIYVDAEKFRAALFSDHDSLILNQ